MEEIGLSRDALSSIIGKIARKRGPASKKTMQKMLDDIKELERLGEKYRIRFEPAQS